MLVIMHKSTDVHVWIFIHCMHKYILCVRYELNDPNLPHAGTRTSTVDDSIVGAGLYEKAGTKLSIPNNTHTKMNGYIKVLVDEHSF